MTSNKFVAVIAQVIVLVLASGYSTFAAGEVDTSFLANLTSAGSGTVNRIVVQPDGKILVGGNFRVVGGFGRSGLVRLNADGTVDASFQPPDYFNGSGSGGTVNAIVVLPDGKILVGGDFQGGSGLLRQGMMRLNTNGSIDETFTTPLNNGGAVLDIVLVPDGDLLIAGTFTINNPGGNRVGIARLNPNGDLDSLIYQNLISLNKIVLLPDGRLVAGSATNVRRFNTDGVFDASYGSITVSGGSVQDLHLLPDGKILVAGLFNNVNGFALIGLFRANQDGGIDSSFNPGGTNPNSGVTGITPLPSGKVLIFGQFSIYNGVARNRAVLINTDGAIDTAITYLGPLYTPIRDIAIQPDGKLMVGATSFASNNALTRLNSDGSVDGTFTLPMGNVGAAYAVLVQPDNKVIVAGQFAFANGVGRASIARFNADGSLDTGFIPVGISSSSAVYDMEIQPDGKILVAVWSGNGNAFRLNPDGSFDVQFSGTDRAYDVEYLPDGKILVAHNSSIKRFNANGTQDGTFSTVSANGFIYKMAIQPDTKIVLGGTFTSVGGQNRGRVARVRADGVLDGTFAPPGGANANINTVAVQADGKVLVGGDFPGLNFDTNRKYLGRLNEDGSLDTSFTPVLNGPVLGFKLQSDGKILVGGAFNVVTGNLRAGIVRLNQDGSVDTGFNTGSGTNSTVWGIDQQSDGKIVYVGQFSSTNGFSTLGVGRLLNASVPLPVLFDYDGDRRSDVSVFRPSENRWYVIRSSDSVITQQVFAIAGDIPVPADYDGDGKTDVAIYRPSVGAWWYSSSINGAQINVNWGGEAGDIPRPSDFNGDGKTDFVFFRPTNNFWYRITSTGTVSNVQFGLGGDKPVRGDFDGDGKSDVAIYRPSTGDWWYQSSINNAQLAVRWGISTDIPAPADFDGDGKTDFAVYRPSTGVWYIINSGNGSFTITAFGISEDKPIPADYDGDGRADISVFRPSTGVWYLNRSTSGFTATQFGIGTDIPTENAFVGN